MKTQLQQHIGKSQIKLSAKKNICIKGEMNIFVLFNFTNLKIIDIE